MATDFRIGDDVIAEGSRTKLTLWAKSPISASGMAKLWWATSENPDLSGRWLAVGRSRGDYSRVGWAVWDLTDQVRAHLHNLNAQERSTLPIRAFKPHLLTYLLEGSRLTFHESYGWVSEAQREAYRRAAITPFAHDQLVEKYGQHAHALITADVTLTNESRIR